MKHLIILLSIACLTTACAGRQATLAPPGLSAEFAETALPPPALTTATLSRTTSTPIHLQETPTMPPLPLGTVSRVTPTAASGPLVIEVGDYYFRPQRATITVGTTVIWYPVGELTHTIDPVEPPAPWRGGATAGAGTAIYKFTFSRPGTYKYGCNYHPAMMDAWIYVVEGP